MKLKELIKGIELPEQFVDKRVQGRILIYDADPLAYRASATVKKLSTGITRFQQGVLEMMYLTKSESAMVHLTHKDCDKAGRHNIIAEKVYQGNRTGRSRPLLLHDLRHAVVEENNVLPEYQAWEHMELEADDVCMIQSYKYKDNSVLVSEDKDLRQTPYPFYDTYLDKIVQAKGVGSLWEHVTPTGNVGLHGIGRIFFWAQMMCGDTADNIKGLKLYKEKPVGYIRTIDTLSKFNDTDNEEEMANLVINAYRIINQNPIPEGYLLHMLRTWDDSFLKLIDELDWTEKNKKFLEDCKQRRWHDGI